MRTSIFTLIILTTTLSFAQPQWHKLTGFNSSNSVVSLDYGFGNRNYAVTADRWIYFYENGSDMWIPFNHVPDFYNVGAIKASKVSNRVFCPTLTSGLTYTDNHGLSWQNNNLTDGGGTTGFGANVLSFDVHNNRVLVCTAGPFSQDISNFMHVSTNNGNTFQSIPSIPFYPTDFHMLSDFNVVSNTANGLYQSTNYTNQNWQLIAFDGLNVTDFSFSQNIWFASVIEFSGQGNVYSSSNEGMNWQILGAIPANQGVSQIAYDEDNNVVYATTTSGVYMYNNNSWQLISPETRAKNIIVTENQSALFGGLRVNGAQIKDLNAPAAQALNQGLSLVADKMAITSNNQIYTASIYTSFLSKFNISEHSYSSYNLFDQFDDTRILQLQSSPDGQCIIGGLHYIAKTLANGNMPNIISQTGDAPPAPIYNVLFPQHLWVGNNASIAMIQHQIQNYVDYSPDMGENWNTLFQTVPGQSPGFFFIHKVLSGTTNHYILGTSNQTANKIIITYDENNNDWVTLPQILAANNVILDIFIDRFNQLYAATSSALYAWNMQSQTWDPLNINLGLTTSNKAVEMIFDYENRPHVLVTTMFSDFDEEGYYFLPTNSDEFEHIAFAEENGQIVRLKNLAVDSLNMPYALSNLEFRDTEIEGIYYLNSEPILTDNSLINNFELSIFPNPASTFLTINTNHTDNNFVQFISMDGKISQVQISNGVIDVSNFTNGIYVLQITINNHTFQEKLLIHRP